MADTDTDTDPSFDDPERAARRKAIRAKRAASTVPRPPAGMAPTPVVPTADIPEARARLEEKKQAQFEDELGVGDAADAATGEFMGRVAPWASPPQPTATPGLSGWGQVKEAAGALAASFAPQVAQRDTRPLSDDEKAERYRAFTTEISYPEQLLGIEPGAESHERFERPEGPERTVGSRLQDTGAAVWSASVPGVLARQAQDAYDMLRGEKTLAEATPLGRAVLSMREQPHKDAVDAALPVENGTMYWMRLLGTPLEAFAVETIGRAPSPVPRPEMDGLQTVSEALLGVEVSHGQKTRYDNPVADWLEGMAERIEEGRGLDSDVMASFRERFGTEYANEGYYLGLALSALTPWELPLAKGAGAVGRVVDAVRANKELDPNLGTLEALLHAIRNSTVDVGKRQGEYAGEALEAGELAGEDIPEAVLGYAETLARAQTGQSFDEVLRTEGVGIPRHEMTVDQVVVDASKERAALAKEAGELNEAGTTAALAHRDSEIRRVRLERRAEVQAKVDEAKAHVQKLVADVEAQEAKLAQDEAAAAGRLVSAHEADLAQLAGEVAEKDRGLQEAAAKRVAALQAKHETALAKIAEPVAKLEAVLAKDAEVLARLDRTAQRQQLETVKAQLRSRKLTKDARAALKAEGEKLLADINEADAKAKIIQKHSPKPEEIEKARAKAAERVGVEQQKHADAQGKEAEKLRVAREELLADTVTKRKARDAKLRDEQQLLASSKTRTARRQAVAQQRADVNAKIADTRKKLDEVTDALWRKEVEELKGVVKRTAAIRPQVPPAADDTSFFRSLAAWLKRRPKEGEDRFASVDLQRGDGFERIRQSMKEDPTPDQPRYVLRSAAGEPAADAGTLEELTELMYRRRQAGDEIRWGDQRAVASWGQDATATPPPKPGFERWYHGLTSVPKRGETFTGPLWFTHSLQDALGWATRGMEENAARASRATAEAEGRIWYVDVRADDPRWAGDMANGIAPLRRFEMPEDIASRRAQFSSGGGPRRVVHDFLFSTRLEEDVLAKMPQPAVVVRELQTHAASTAAGRILFDLVMKAKGSTWTPKTKGGQILRDAYRAWSWDRTGVRDGVLLHNMVFVPKQEAPAILREANDMLGITHARWRELLGGAKPDEKEAAKIGRVAEAMDVPFSPTGVVSPALHRAMLGRAVEEVTREVGSVRMRIRGTPAFHDKIMEVMGTMSTDRRHLQGVVGGVQQSLLAKPIRWFMEDRLAGLPPFTRSRLRQLRTELERAGDEVLQIVREIAKKKRGWLYRARDLAPELRKLLPGFAPVVEEDVELAAEVLRVLKDDAADLEALAAEVAARADRSMNWLTSRDKLVRRFGLKRWAEGQQEKMAGIAKRYLTTLVEITGREAPKSGEANHLEELDVDQLVPIYRAVFLEGQPLGPAVLSRLRAMIGKEADAISEQEALTAWLVKLQMDSAKQRAMDDLLEAGVAVKDTDPRLLRGFAGRSDVLLVVANGEHMYGRARAIYPAGAIAWAESTLRGWGIEPGDGAQVVTLQLPNGYGVIIPKYLEDEVQRIVSAGSVEAASITKSARAIARREGNVAATGATLKALYMEPIRWTKSIVLTGFGAFVNFGYFMGQALSVWPTMLATRGVVATARAAPSILAAVPVAALDAIGAPVPRFMQHHSMVGEILIRLHAPPGAPVYAPRAPKQALIETKSGVWYTVDELVELARAHGLSDNIAAFEAGPRLSEALHTETMGTLEPSKWWTAGGAVAGAVVAGPAGAVAGAAAGAVAGRPLMKLNDVMRDLSSVFDQSARIASFLDEVIQGTPPPVAAERARKAVLDFRDLAPTEAAFGRMAIMFYSFARKNLDTFVRAAVEHPERLAQQARLAHASYENHHSSDLERGAARNSDPGKLTVAVDHTPWGKDGRVNPDFVANLWQSTPMGISEMLAQFSLVFAPAWPITGSPIMGSRTDEAFDLLVPYWSTALILAGADSRAEDPRANRVPPWVMDFPGLNSIFIDHLGVGPVKLEDDEDELTHDADATLAHNFGDPSVWTVGGAKRLTASEQAVRRRVYHALMTWTGQLATRDGTPMRQARAVGLYPPRPGLTQFDEAASYLFGLRVTPQRSEDAADNAVLLREQGRINREASAVGSLTEPK
jgi:hypothetical protein